VENLLPEEEYFGDGAKALEATTRAAKIILRDTNMVVLWLEYLFQFLINPFVLVMM